MHRLTPVALIVLLSSCGARTDLEGPGPERLDAAGLDASGPRLDAGPVPDGVDAGWDAGAPPDAGEICPELSATFSTTPPMIVIILDRSGSMRFLFREWTPQFPSASRWEVMRELLVGVEGRVDGLVGNIRARVGLSTFTTEPGVCPAIRWVSPAFRNLEAIRAELQGSGPGGGTPTAEAIDDALARLPAHRMENEAVSFILATDGEPGGCGGGGGRASVLRAVGDAYDQGVRTFVVGVGDDTSLEHLQEVANVGVGLDSATGTAEFWNGRSPARLASALNEAASRVTTCYGDLSRPLRDLSRACEVEVSVGGDPLPCGGTDGVRFPDERHVELSGAACNAFRDSRTIAFNAPCDLL